MYEARDVTEQERLNEEVRKHIAAMQTAVFGLKYGFCVGLILLGLKLLGLY